ncbi:hypothetical protein [Shewanella xiamenensis]|uniref:hypothetical protein n=1 Tax=Shewanella xiamenensis TaxID=332186 RepID=UPI0015598E8E|nr:hypothetical protein [Shewanella xiamenensis]
MINITLSQQILENEIVKNLEKKTYISFADCLLYSFKKCLANQVSGDDRVINNLLVDAECSIENKTSLLYGYSLASIEYFELALNLSITIKVKRNFEDDEFEYAPVFNCFDNQIFEPTFAKKLKKQINYTYSNLRVQLPRLDVRSKLSINCLSLLEETLSPEGLYLCEYDLFRCAHNEMTFVNQSDGKRYLCSCTEGFHEELLSDPKKASNHDSYHSERFMLSELVSLPRLKDICHLCVIKEGGVEESIIRYGEPSPSLHYSYEAFAERKKHESGWSWICDNLEQALGRQKWVNENKVFLFTKDLMTEQRILREASPTWLGKQRLDVYLPELRLAIEYQGKQHTDSVEFFGGQDTYEKNLERDARKARLCKENGVSLIYVYHHEKVTLNLMKRKLQKYLNK